jgi:hypothetical protein
LLNTLLWALQIILCIKLLSVAFSHGLRRDQTKFQQAMRKVGAPAARLLTFAAVATPVVAAGLVLPAASASLNWLAPVAAATTALLMLLSAGIHLRARETPNIPVALILWAMGAFVAYGRWMLSPLGT